ncbi:hypothetical protein FQN54_007129 [Arachnomyces sp. PD_36]|nr:hypothetical protein FQN54_007129 [Arachnomyces sp. PD_36]
MAISRIFALSFGMVGFIGQAASFSKFSNWAPPGPTDVRGPCPALNTLANHHFLPHSGKDIDVPVLAQGLQDAFNVAIDFSILIGGLGVMSSDDILGLSFDLDELSKHEQMIEHDGSLSRGDAYFGDNHSFNSTIWQTVLDYFEGSDTVTFEAAAKARYNRIKVESERNPDFTYNAKDVILSYGESALYLSVLGDPVTGHPPVEWVRIFFEHERLPYNEGWRTPTTPTTMASIMAMEVVLNAAGGEALPEGMELTENALRKILAGESLDAVVGTLPDLPL